MRGSAAFRAAVAPGGVLAGPWVKNELWRRAKAVPSLDQCFAEDKSLRDRVSGQNLITFTRASSGTFVGSNGVLQTAVTNVPRFDHNPTTGESLGLLVEELRTNSIRNNTMVGAVAGTPGTLPTNWSGSSSANGLTREISFGVESGISYIDLRFYGTPTTTAGNFLNFEANTQAAAAVGQLWTKSLYVRLSSGSLSNTSFTGAIVERSAAGANIGSTPVSLNPATASLVSQRVSFTRTLANASTAFINSQITFSYTEGLAIDITLRIGMPQLEQGAFATSVIPTSTTAVTRSADVASISGSNFSSWYRQDEGTVFVEYNRPATVSGLRSMAALSNGGFNNRTTFRTDSATLMVIFAVDGGAGQATFPLAVVSGANNKTAIAYKANNYNAAANGTAGIQDTAASVHATNQLSIGSVLNAEPSCSYIRRLTYWPTRLPNSTLQAVTQ